MMHEPGLLLQLDHSVHRQTTRRPALYPWKLVLIFVNLQEESLRMFPSGTITVESFTSHLGARWVDQCSTIGRLEGPGWLATFLEKIHLDGH